MSFSAARARTALAAPDEPAMTSLRSRVRPWNSDFRRGCLLACASAVLATTLAGRDALSQSTAPAAPSGAPAAASTRPDPVKDYLWEVYQRSTVKKDGSGEFTWKDIDAAKHAGLSMQDYTIGGIDPDFRELLFAIGQAMDAAGIEWSILSGYRDDYRQNLAAGFKSHGGYSFHGGSTATGGYGHGCAIDLSSPDRLSDDPVWAWFDQRSHSYGLRRPLPATDPVHIQPLLGPGWHEKAAALRRARLAASGGADQAREAAYPTTAAEAGVTPEQWGCVRPKGQETAHSEEKGHRKSRLAEDKVGSRHANTAPTESLYKPASASHTDIKPTSQTPEAKRTPPRADGKPAVSHGEAKPAPQRADAKTALPRGESKPAPQRADTKLSKPVPVHGEAKPPSAQTDKARVGTTKSGTGT
jgi:hypothetical protein